MVDTVKIVLHVEDEPAHAEMTRLVIEDLNLNCRVEHVADGQQALDYLCQRSRYQQAARPDLVLLDLRMPRIDGFEVLKAIKNDPSLTDIPVVVLTTSTAQADMLKAYRHHANGYLVKAVDFDAFSDMIAATCRYWLTWNRSLSRPL